MTSRTGETIGALNCVVYGNCGEPKHPCLTVTSAERSTKPCATYDDIARIAEDHQVARQIGFAGVSRVLALFLLVVGVGHSLRSEGQRALLSPIRAAHRLLR